MTATRSDFQVHQMSQKGKKFNEKMFQTSLIESSKWLQTIYTKKCLLIWHNMRHGMSYEHVCTSTGDKPIGDNGGGQTDNFLLILVILISFEVSFTSEEKLA